MTKHKDRLRIPLIVLGIAFLVLALLFLGYAFLGYKAGHVDRALSFLFYGSVFAIISVVDIFYTSKIASGRSKWIDPEIQEKLRGLTTLAAKACGVGVLVGVTRFENTIDEKEHNIEIVLRRVNPKLSMFVDGNEILSRTWHFPVRRKSIVVEIELGSVSHHLRLTLDMLFGSDKFEFYVDEKHEKSGRLEAFWIGKEIQQN